MPSLPPEDLLPVLIADLADDEAHDILEAAAFTGSQVFLPLDAAPVNAAQHVLEVHLPSLTEPIFYLALPLGPPTEDGFPMRIRPMPDALPRASRSEAPAGAIIRSRRAPPNRALSASHTADLSQVGPLPTEPEDPLLGRALAGGKLIIEHLIGRGGVGAVYKARHRELRMPVAVKVLHESFQADIDFCRRFYAEALAASRLDHPNITRVIDFGQEPDGLLYLAMEFLDGVELRAVLEKERFLPAQRIAELVMQTCAGLSHAHARGIVHRDIKPENLVLVPGQDDDGQVIELVKVCDFGIAQHRALPDAAEAGVIAGTPEYMSPEQCRGDALDARSDVYACGVVLYELATGQVPFMAERPQSIMNKHQFTDVLPPTTIRPGVDAVLEQIILKALSKEPEDRPQSMRDLRTELRALLGPVAVEGSPSPSAVKASPLGRSMTTGEEMRPVLPRPAGAAQPPPLPPRAARPEGIPPSTRSPAPGPAPAPRAPAPGGPAPAARAPAHGAPPRAPAPGAPSAPGARAPGAPPPAWLERGAAYGPPSPTTYGGGGKPEKALPMPGPARSMDEIAEALVRDAAGWLQRFTRTMDPLAFTQLAYRLEPSLRALAQAGETAALWAVSTALHRVATEGTQVAGSRAHVAVTVLRVFDDPVLLSSVAEHLLTGREDARDHAKRVLLRAGVAGAYGLYGARVKLANEPGIRPVFTAAMKDFGSKGWPVVRAALEKIIASDQSANARTMALAEDLLLAVPVVGDESAGHVVVKYLRVNVSGVCRAASGAIVKLWGERSKPLLVGMLQSKEDAVRIAGVAGLRQLGAIDEHVVPRLQAILLRRIPAGEELRATAALALSHAVPSAVQPAVSLLSQLITPSREASVEARPGPAGAALSREDAVVLAIARSLLAIGGKGYRGLIAERGERSPEPLRTHLRNLLAS